MAFKYEHSAWYKRDYSCMLLTILIYMLNFNNHVWNQYDYICFCVLTGSEPEAACLLNAGSIIDLTPEVAFTGVLLVPTTHRPLSRREFTA